MNAIFNLKHDAYILVSKIRLFYILFINKLKFYYYKNYKEKHQKDFFQFLKILNKINIKNRTYNIIDNYIFKRDKIFFKKKLNKNYYEIIITLKNKYNGLLKYKLDNKYYAKLIQANHLNFLVINTSNIKKIDLNHKKFEIKNIHYVKKKKKKLVLLLMVDGLSKEITEKINFLTKNSIKFTHIKNSWSNSSWTLPSTASLFTGRFASRHRCYKPNSFYDNDHYRQKVHANKSLFEIFKSEDFVTSSFSGYNRLNPSYDFDRGIDYFKFCEKMETSEVLEEVNSQIKLFKNSSNIIFAHLFDSHHHAKLYKTKNFFSMQDRENFEINKNIETDIKKIENYNLNSKNVFQINSRLFGNEKISDHKYILKKISDFINNLDIKRYDDVTILIFGDHGTRLSNKNNLILSNEKNNIGLLVYDNMKKIYKNSIVQTIDIMPSLIERYFNRKYYKSLKKVDGINSIFKNMSHNLIINESIYNNFYDLVIRDNNCGVYYSGEIKKNKIKKKNSKIYFFQKDTNIKKNIPSDKSRILINELKKHLD